MPGVVIWFCLYNLIKHVAACKCIKCSDMPVDNWASVDTALVFQMTRVTAYCSLAHLVRSEKQEYTATAVTSTNRKNDKTD